MSNDVLKKIRQFGHWRVNIRPVKALDEKLSFAKCREILTKSAVSMRGWDFPHLSLRNDEHGAIQNGDGFVESWTEWYGFLELFRIYRSSQFIGLMALREDTMPNEHGNPSVPILNFVGTIYSVVEFVEFLSRMHRNGIYQSGAQLIVGLHNVQDRVLVAGQGRIPFFDRYVFGSDTITVERNFDVGTLAGDCREVAVSISREIIEHFGLSPDPSQLRAEVDKFYRRDFSY